MKKGHSYILIAQKMHTKSNQPQIIKSVAKPETQASIYITATPPESSIEVDMHVFSGLWVNKQDLSLYTLEPMKNGCEEIYDFQFGPIQPNSDKKEVNEWNSKEGGMTIDEKGVVVDISEGSKAELYGIKEGWEIVEVTCF